MTIQIGRPWKCPNRKARRRDAATGRHNRPAAAFHWRTTISGHDRPYHPQGRRDVCDVQQFVLSCKSTIRPFCVNSANVTLCVGGLRGTMILCVP